MTKIGVDIIENKRVAKLYDRYKDSFVNKVLTEDEKTIFNKKTDKVKYLASRWAAKEAVGKALGCGLSCGIKNIEILNRSNGQPYVKLYNKASDKLLANGSSIVEISISHEKHYSIAFVITL